MKKLYFCAALSLLLCLGRCTSSVNDNVDRYYADGKYETTLTENNCFTLINADAAVAEAKAPDPVLILIGGAWCP